MLLFKEQNSQKFCEELNTLGTSVKMDLDTMKIHCVGDILTIKFFDSQLYVEDAPKSAIQVLVPRLCTYVDNRVCMSDKEFLTTKIGNMLGIDPLSLANSTPLFRLEAAELLLHQYSVNGYNTYRCIYSDDYTFDEFAATIKIIIPYAVSYLRDGVIMVKTKYGTELAFSFTADKKGLKFDLEKSTICRGAGQDLQVITNNFNLFKLRFE